jgi:ketosteroid isomerase-like protein
VCTYSTEKFEVTASSGKGPHGWFPLQIATVYYDHPVHAPHDHTVNIDFMNPDQGPAARVAVELSLDAARELLAALQVTVERAGNCRPGFITRCVRAAGVTREVIDARPLLPDRWERSRLTTTDSEGDAMRVRTTREVLDLYNDAFRLHDPRLLNDLIADDCVIEDTAPAPDGARREGGQACLARWSELAGNRALEFTPEAAEIHGDLAVQPWALQWGDGDQDRVRGVNLIRIREGKIVEARGYVKAG